jgi:hypothetical protein
MGFTRFLGPAGSEAPADSGEFIPAADIRAAIRTLFKLPLGSQGARHENEGITPNN